MRGKGNKMAGYSRQYILLRASRTLQCMTVIKNGTPTWEWSEQTVSQFNIKYQECLSLVDSESDEAADTTSARGTRDENLDNLRSKGRLALRRAPALLCCQRRRAEQNRAERAVA